MREKDRREKQRREEERRAKQRRKSDKLMVAHCPDCLSHSPLMQRFDQAVKELDELRMELKQINEYLKTVVTMPTFKTFLKYVIIISITIFGAIGTLHLRFSAQDSVFSKVVSSNTTNIEALKNNQERIISLNEDFKKFMMRSEIEDEISNQSNIDNDGG